MPTQDDKLKKTIGKELADICVSIRQRRRWIEEQWLKNHRTWQALGIYSRYKGSDTGKGHFNIPTARRAAERTIIREAKLLLPNIKWFSTDALGITSDERRANVDAYMDYIIKRRIPMKTNILQLCRSNFLYGRCHLKTSVSVHNNLVWPFQKVVDPFSFYIYPETTTTPEPGTLCFEDSMYSYETYKALVSKGFFDDVSAADLRAPEWPYHLVERLAHQGLSHQDVPLSLEKVKDSLNKVKASFASMSEIWTYRESQLYQAYILWNHVDGAKCVGFFKSQYDTPLYRTSIHRSLPNETYTNSFMDDIAELQDLSNDQLVQFVEAIDWEQGFVGIDVANGGKRTDTWQSKGRAKWHFDGNPRELLNLIAPPNTSNNLLKAWQISYGMIQSLAGIGTIGEGQPGRNMPRAGNAVESLITLATSDIYDAAELKEQEILTPSLGDIYRVSDKFIPTQQLMVIPGGTIFAENEAAETRILSKDDLRGDYEFTWIGSLQFQNQEIRAQRMLIFLNLVPSLQPVLEAQGYTLDVANLIQEIWRSSLGEKSLNEIVRKMSPQELQQSQLRSMQQAQSPRSNGSANGMQVGGMKPTSPSLSNI